MWLRKAGVEPGDTSRAAGRGGGERRACADVGDARSGITRMRAARVSCERATALATAGPATVEDAGFQCDVTDEDFDGPVVRITRDCRTADGARLSYVTRS